MGNLASVQSKLLRLWGKTDRYQDDPQVFHPALFHMLDVGNVAQAFLSQRFATRLKNVLSVSLQQTPEILLDWLPWLISMHDIGKVSIAFQVLDQGQRTRLEQEKFPLENVHFMMDVRHPEISQVYFLETMSHNSSFPKPYLQAWSEIVGGHHGQYQHPDRDIKMARRVLSFEPAEWGGFREATDNFLRSVFMPGGVVQFSSLGNISVAIMTITGFLILCDWIGSDSRNFPPEPGKSLEEYVLLSRQRAEKAIAKSGMAVESHSTASIRVEELFADLGPLRPLQLSINTIPVELLQSPSLTIIEAPTGEGKTEAALALAHRIAQATGTEELYYALPTMATSNQMFGRLQAHLQRRLGLPIEVKLVHGQSFLFESELRQEFSLALVEPLGNGNNPKQSDVNQAISWFNTKKRALLAPFGVGTIDQAELAALNVKHTALRMMGLAGKVIIIDEVHAYDTYMVTIIERLLKWLAVMNTSVILLSATLPKSRRKQLAEAYGVSLNLLGEQEDAYPSILTVNHQDIFHTSTDAWQPDRIVHLNEIHLADKESEAKAEWLLNSVKGGGCACWITNTVRRAQQIFEALSRLSPSDVMIELLHSQYPVDDRQRHESALNNHYGKGDKRPAKGIVVGTQVLEQSLDLDFDVMVSDLAPIDLLLQRAGRLHRHDRKRPAFHAIPRLYINYEITENAEWKPGSDRSVYAEFIIRQTLKTLKNLGSNQINLPDDYRCLIEAVYGDAPQSGDPLISAWDDLEAKEAAAYSEAHQRLLPLPHPRDSFATESATHIQFEEDEGRADWIVAQTRLGERSINLIPIERIGNNAILPGGEKVDINNQASLEIQRKLLKRSIRISNVLAINVLERRAKSEKYLTRLFIDSPLLKGYYPIWLKNGSSVFKLEKGTLRISLDEALGLVIKKEV